MSADKASGPPATSPPAAPAWFRHRRDGAAHLGICLPDGSLHDAGPLAAGGELELLARGGLDADALARRLDDARPVADVEFDVPVARPRKILCLAKNYAAHAAEFGAEVPEEPRFFAKLDETLLPHRGTILLPWWLESRVDHEIELGLILGWNDPDDRGARDVEPKAARRLVAGYTVLDDVTARRMQGDDRKAQYPWLRSKSFDTFCPIGPWVVPAEALPGVDDVPIRLWVGDTLRQDSRTSRMVVDIDHALAALSRHTTLRPGDVVAMGTPEGVGPLRAGDTVVGEIPGIGMLVNDVARAAAPDAGPG